jgi:hypothetical protein
MWRSRCRAITEPRASAQSKSHLPPVAARDCTSIPFLFHFCLSSRLRRASIAMWYAIRCEYCGFDCSLQHFRPRLDRGGVAVRVFMHPPPHFVNGNAPETTTTPSRRAQSVRREATLDSDHDCEALRFILRTARRSSFLIPRSLGCLSASVWQSDTNLCRIVHVILPFMRRMGEISAS